MLSYASTAIPADAKLFTTFMIEPSFTPDIPGAIAIAAVGSGTLGRRSTPRNVTPHDGKATLSRSYESSLDPRDGVPSPSTLALLIFNLHVDGATCQEAS